MLSPIIANLPSTKLPGWPVRRRRLLCAIAIVASCLCVEGLYAQSLDKLVVHLSLGHTTSHRKPFQVRLVTAGGVSVVGESVWQGAAGAGHVETHGFELAYPKMDVRPIQDLHVIWADLIAHSDADTAARLLGDPALRIDPRQITVELNTEGTSGFTLTIDQLTRNGTFWIPSLDVYLTADANNPSFDEDQRQLVQHRGSRILDQVESDKEASYEQFKQLWEDMGNPAYTHPVQEGPGHIVGLTWDSALPKFGVDRAAGVWNDYGSADQFRFWFGFGNLADGVLPYWKEQHLAQGLPVITTVFEREDVRYEVEQFAYPLNGPPHERTGDLTMVLLQRVRLSNLTDSARTVPVSMSHERGLPPQENAGILGESRNGVLLLSDEARHQAILAVDGKGAKIDWAGVYEHGQKRKRVDVTVAVQLPARGTSEFYVTLPSPIIAHKDVPNLEALEYDKARKETLNFWSDYVAQGATFRVPEPAVNELFNANLWHSLRLPRRHSAMDMDLPYSNFAYDQTGTPWPINQAVYVDYMVYGLRGYDRIATEEIKAIYRNNQLFDGRVDGFAHWHAYTPGMLYAVAQNYLLSNDRESFEQVLPQTLKALDWSIAQIQNASTASGAAKGLVAGPLNDITGSGDWAFNQAYLYAGVEKMSEALARYGDARATDLHLLAENYRASIEHAFRVAAVRSPLVQLRDHTWTSFVPSDANHTGRNYEQWYPSDVDTGPSHLLRLQVLHAQDALADAILNDHEDNLFLHQWGLANEPVYSPQAAAYLFRDDPKATIRTFYSLMAGGFSHSTYEPVEHRWRWGQYFGPPSTDGAWFEIYRNMLIRERDDNTLLLGQAAPREWLQDGKTITVKDAPTWFGNISYEIRSHAATGHIQVAMQLDSRSNGKNLLVRLRHPQGNGIRSVTVNGRAWNDFDPKEEWIRIPNVKDKTIQIDASY